MKDVFRQRDQQRVRHSAGQAASKNRAFPQLPNRPLGGLKNRSKIPFIQQLDGRDFALGAILLSWHKYKRFSRRFLR
jgi:hypothetical protein